jgi:hypothetical protein
MVMVGPCLPELEEKGLVARGEASRAVGVTVLERLGEAACPSVQAGVKLGEVAELLVEARRSWEA